MINENYMEFMLQYMKFEQMHPKFTSFIRNHLKAGIPEGTIIELTVTRPDADPMTTNMKVTQGDIELVEAFKKIGMKHNG